MSAVRAITCPSCGGTMELKAAGYSITVGCQYCGALLDVAHPDVAVISEYETAMRQLAIPLGCRGALFGTEWETIGALSRSDAEVTWTEYLLFNPYAGYRWLVANSGEWQFGTPLIDRPDDDDSGGTVAWRGARYVRDYEPALTTTQLVVGEFYWRVRAGDTVTATTFSRGDEMLSGEWSDDEVNWTQLVSLPVDAVTAAFGLSPPPSGGPRQSFGRKNVPGMTTATGSADDDGLIARLEASYDQAEATRWEDLPKMFGMAFVTLIFSILAMSALGHSGPRVTNSVAVTVDGREENITVGTLNVTRPYQAVSITASASQFENRWVDIDYMLVNRSTQLAYTASGVVEHYTGSDGDGPWSEGGYQTITRFSSIPRGSYDVVADLSAHTWRDPAASSWSSGGTSSSPWASAEQIGMTLTASTGGIFWGNFWTEMLLLLGLPLVILWWRHEHGD